ncbi:hypothetical protein [Butyrivibrio sp. MC2021]|uniref:hypothetical protein n=1 Tax=Butyrivibrio sp. MC2021 TaxID=1408306 RepID=UPI00047BAF5F|nr:hypothetical protein [Butyrivibrio sp. MC2021]
MAEDYLTYCSKLVDELCNGIDNGDLQRDEIPDKYRWEHMEALFQLSHTMNGGQEMYEKIYDMVISSAERRLKKKAINGKKINVLFQSYSAAQWPAADVYNAILNDQRINVGVIVSPMVDRDEESRLNTYSQVKKWFIDRQYKIIEGLKEDNNSYIQWQDLQDVPDVLYITSSWYDSLPQGQRFTDLPLKCLVAYIPYGLYLANGVEGSYAKYAVYDKELFSLMWRVYCDCAKNLEGYQKYQYIKGKNVRFSGYSKMDYFYTPKEWSEEEINTLWKIPKGKKSSGVKRVIIAPHFSVGNTGHVLFSTFQKNCWFLLFLAEKYKDSVSFILKPHPNLRFASVAYGLFKSYREYDDYLQNWNDLPNCRVVQDAGYLDIFATSDAMIMDSGSFLGEYLYTQKPLLYLTRPEQAFLPIGDKVVNAYYRTPGEDYMGIESFLNDVVLRGNDPMKHAREEVFKEEYDYLSMNKIKASEYICKELFELMRV